MPVNVEHRGQIPTLVTAGVEVSGCHRGEQVPGLAGAGQCPGFTAEGFHFRGPVQAQERGLAGMGCQGWECSDWVLDQWLQTRIRGCPGRPAVPRRAPLSGVDWHRLAMVGGEGFVVRTDTCVPRRQLPPAR